MSGAIEILLAVYNGERFLQQQLASLLAQTETGWTLLARDDGSTDRSRELLETFRAAHPGKVRLLAGAGRNAGVVANFSALLERATAPYVMLCDQDDVWLPEKIALSLRKMHELEAAGGAALPLLVHTDMQVVDDDLRVLAGSLWRYQKSDPVRGAALNRLLLQNCATGCSFLANRRLLELALPVPPEAMMHDWWLALVAAAFGRIGFVPEPTLRYRQHAANDTGAKPWSFTGAVRALARAESRRRLGEERRRILAGLARQAHAFRARYAASLTPRQRGLLEAFIGLDDASYLRRKWLIVRHGLFYTGLGRNIGRLVFR